MVTNQLKKKIPSIFYKAIDDSLAYGAWVYEDGDKFCVELDSYLVANSYFKKHLKSYVANHCSRLLRQDTDEKSAFEELTSIYNLMKSQLEWSFKIMDASRALTYTRLVYFQITTMARVQRDLPQISADEKDWNLEKVSVGESIRGFFKIILRDKKYVDHEIYPEIESSVSAIEIDLISLPSLIDPNATDSTIQNSVKTLIHAIDVLKKLPDKQAISFPASYWLAKAYRHIAMANIKKSRFYYALIFLHISSMYIRYLKGDVRKELTNERRRGFAELYKALGGINKAMEYLEGTNYHDSSIAGYLGDPEETDIGNLTVNLCLIRHAERDSDEYKRFGFTTLTTDKGGRQLAAMVASLKRIVGGRYSHIIIISSEHLAGDAKSIENELQKSFKSEGCKVRSTSKKEWNPIDVGAFRGLDERRASVEFPGEYKVLTDYRNGHCCGYDLKFPDGETVLDFERRISCGFSELLQHAVKANGSEDLASHLENTLIVVLGHTSSITACLNIISDFENIKLDKAYYKFFPIETGSIIYGSIDLKDHTVNLESRQLLVI